MTNQIALFSYSVNALDAELRNLRPKVMLLNKNAIVVFGYITLHTTQKKCYTPVDGFCVKRKGGT